MAKIGRRIALTVLVLGLAGFGIHYFKLGYAECHPRRTVVSEAERHRAQQSLPGLAEVTFAAHDGVILRGWFVPPKNGTVIVLVHGLFSNRAGLLPDAEVLAHNGYGVLLFDSRAHGESGGNAATWGSLEAGDVGEASRFVRRQPGVTNVGLLGFSVGASAVARAAADDPTIGAVILYATWTSLRDEIAYKMRRGHWLGVEFALLGFRWSGTDIDAIRPEADLRRIAPRPLLMISGGRDTDTPPWVMDEMFARASGQKQWWRLPEVGHGGYVEEDPLAYERHVIGFLNAAFGGRAG